MTEKCATVSVLIIFANKVTVITIYKRLPWDICGVSDIQSKNITTIVVS